jgi:phospholipid/cholesterol/gamma-HCH transport system substrate-binding protein
MHKKSKNGDTIQSYSESRTDEMLETLDVTNKNAAILTADLLKITQEITQGNGTVGLLIERYTYVARFERNHL